MTQSGESVDETTSLSLKLNKHLKQSQDANIEIEKYKLYKKIETNNLKICNVITVRIFNCNRI